MSKTMTNKAIKDIIRADAYDRLFPLMVQEFGEEFVSRTEDGIAVAQLREDLDTDNQEIVFVFKPVVKNWYDTVGTKRDSDAYDRIAEAEYFEKSQHEKALKALEIQEKKEAKIKADEKRRTEILAKKEAESNENS